MKWTWQMDTPSSQGISRHIARKPWKDEVFIVLWWCLGSQLLPVLGLPETLPPGQRLHRCAGDHDQVRWITRRGDATLTRRDGELAINKRHIFVTMSRNPESFGCIICIICIYQCQPFGLNDLSRRNTWRFRMAEKHRAWGRFYFLPDREANQAPWWSFGPFRRWLGLECQGSLKTELKQFCYIRLFPPRSEAQNYLELYPKTLSRICHMISAINPIKSQSITIIWRFPKVG